MKKEKKIQSKSSRGWLVALAVAGALSCLSILGLYIYHFPGPFSPERDHWGSFGDFYGGVLNPLLSFLALIAVIYTIRQQQEEIEQTRAEMKASVEAQEQSAQAQQAQLERLQREERKEDLLRIINAIYREVFDDNLMVVVEPGSVPGQPGTVLGDLVGPNKKQDQAKILKYSRQIQLSGQDQSAGVRYLQCVPELEKLNTQLIELGRFLDAFDELAQDDRMITDYYRRRLWPIVYDLTHLSIMRSPHDELFHDESMRESSRELNRKPAPV